MKGADTPRRIFYVTGTRADFGLMAATLQGIAAHPQLALQVAVTGMHLSAQFGHTVDEVETALPLGSIVARIPVDIDERSPAAMSRAVGQTLLGLTAAMDAHKPHIVLLLGDRGEMLAGAIAALHLGIPIAHLHGGERTGTVDDAIRHAITKLSHWHFVATEASRERVVRLGEQADHVWVTGAPSLDGLNTIAAAAPRAEVLARLGLQANARYALVLLHPVVQEAQNAVAQTQALVEALKVTSKDAALCVVWLAPNADAGSGGIVSVLGNASETWPALHTVTHLPRDTYVQALAQADVLVGNSSSGILEAASLGTPVVNIGNRQRNRERNANTLDCDTTTAAITAALQQALAHGRCPAENRYGDGQSSPRIVQLLAETPIAADLLDKVNSY